MIREARLAGFGILLGSCEFRDRVWMPDEMEAGSAGEQPQPFTVR